MTATGHAVIGTVIAAKIVDPAIAIPIALGSHFLADAVPHWDTGTNAKLKSRKAFVMESILDVILSFGLSYTLIALLFPQTNILYAFLLVVMAQLPDWLTAPYLFLNMKFPPFSTAYKIQKIFDTRLGLPWGFINQVAVLLALVVLGKII